LVKIQTKKGEDCLIILKQISEIEDISQALSQAKRKIKELEQHSKKSEALCAVTIKVKLQYEEVMANLYNNLETRTRI
jgi:hypothetical protein